MGTPLFVLLALLAMALVGALVGIATTRKFWAGVALGCVPGAVGGGLLLLTIGALFSLWDNPHRRKPTEPGELPGRWVIEPAAQRALALAEPRLGGSPNYLLLRAGGEGFADAPWPKGRHEGAIRWRIDRQRPEALEVRTTQGEALIRLHFGEADGRLQLWFEHGDPDGPIRVVYARAASD